MINFPDTPTNGQTFASGSTVWRWDTAKWVNTATGGMPEIPLAIAHGGTNNTSLPLTAGPASFGLTTTLLQTIGSQVQPATDTIGTIGTWGQGQVMLLSCGNAATPPWGGYLGMFGAGGTLAAPTATPINMRFAGIEFSGWSGSAIAWGKAGVYATATETWTSTAQGMRLHFTATAAGSTATGVVLAMSQADAQYTDRANFTPKRWRFAINSGDDGAAATIDYRGYDTNALCIVGAGISGSRLVHLWDNVTVDAVLTVSGASNLNGYVTANDFKSNNNVWVPNGYCNVGGYVSAGGVVYVGGTGGPYWQNNGGWMYTPNNLQSNGTIKSDSTGRFVSVNSGNNPSFCVWDTSRGVAAGMFISDNLYFGNMDGAGNYAGSWYFRAPNASDFFTAGNLHPSNDGSYYFCISGGNPMINWNGNCYSYYTRSNGNLAFVVNGTGAYYYDWGAALLFNQRGGMQGYGPYNNISDIRTKKDVTPATQGLDVILKLKPIRFQRLTQPVVDPDPQMPPPQDHPIELGFAAQDVEEVLPEAVHVGPSSDLLSISSETIVAVLVRAVQELAAEVRELKERV